MSDTEHAPSSGIGELQRLRLDELSTYYKNPRRGNVEAIAASMKTNGVFRPLVVNKGTHTGRKNEVLAGNHSLSALRTLAQESPDDERWQTADVYLVDVDDDRATRIVISDNRTSDLGKYDDTELAELLESIGEDLEGTGYNDDDISDLLEGLADQYDDTDTMPDAGDADDDDEHPQSYSIVVECDDEQEQARLLDKFMSEGLTCRSIM